MKRNTGMFIVIAAWLALLSLPLTDSSPRRKELFASAASRQPQFTAVQPDLFGISGGQPNCWADFDNDGDLDLFVGMKGNVPNKLYRNDNGTFTEIA
ncbi:MAG: VCBS repeat-containing protein, partial [Acidobacteriota bacterium]